MAKSRGPSSNKNNDLKTAVILVLLLVVGLQGFWLWQSRHKEPPLPKKTGTWVAVVKSPVVARIPTKQGAPAPIVTPKFMPKAIPGSAGQIAFVIDDWGYTVRNCHYLQEIDAPIAVAVLPNLRNTENVIKCAKASNKIVMLHLPLEPYHNNDKYPDNYLITTTMKPAMVEKLLMATLAKMPQVEGVNNHMGSKATESAPLMKFIFRHLKKKNLFFMDSMTSPHHSVCGELADQMKLPFAQRDVFLDNVNKRLEIEKQIAELAQKARRKGYAIAIGHDRELTLQIIKEQIPILRAQGFKIVGVRDLLRNQ